LPAAVAVGEQFDAHHLAPLQALLDGCHHIVKQIATAAVTQEASDEAGGAEDAATGGDGSHEIAKHLDALAVLQNKARGNLG